MKNLAKVMLMCFALMACDTEKNYNMAVITDDGEFHYIVQNAQTPEELEKGLMGIDVLPENGGMIFDLRGYEDVAMWMKDTHIPLDMIFTDNSGNVVWVYENAEPMSEKLIESPVPFSFIVELNGGQAAKHNIKAGSLLKHEFFDNFE